MQEESQPVALLQAEDRSEGHQSIHQVQSLLGQEILMQMRTRQVMRVVDVRAVRVFHGGKRKIDLTSHAAAWRACLYGGSRALLSSQFALRRRHVLLTLLLLMFTTEKHHYPVYRSRSAMLRMFSRITTPCQYSSYVIAPTLYMEILFSSPEPPHPHAIALLVLDSHSLMQNRNVLSGV